MRNRQHNQTANRPAPTPVERAEHHADGLATSVAEADPVNADLHARHLLQLATRHAVPLRDNVHRLMDKARALALPNANPMLMLGIE